MTLTAKKMRDEMAHIDILINNGAQWLPGRMDEHDAYAIVSTISSGVTGTLLFTRGLIKPLEASGARRHPQHHLDLGPAQRALAW